MNMLNTERILIVKHSFSMKKTWLMMAQKRHKKRNNVPFRFTADGKNVQSQLHMFGQNCCVVVNPCFTKLLFYLVLLILI